MIYLLEFMLYPKNLSSLIALTAKCSCQKSTTPLPKTNFKITTFYTGFFPWVSDERINCLLESSVCICILSQIGFTSNADTSLKIHFSSHRWTWAQGWLMASASLLTSYSAEVLWVLWSKVLSNLSFASRPVITALIQTLIVFFPELFG